MKYVKVGNRYVNIEQADMVYVEESFDIDEDTGLKLEPSKWNVVAQIGNYAKFLGRYDSYERAVAVLEEMIGLVYRMPKE